MRERLPEFLRCAHQLVAKRATNARLSRSGNMSLPRCIVPNKTYLITRRCAFRKFLLRPSAWTNEIITYCLCVAAQKTDVQVHVACAMSNHWHLVVTDTEGRLPEFLRYAHQLIAKCINASYGRWENVWAAEATNVVELLDEDAVLEKMAYVIANPTAAGLVRKPKHWPGVLTLRLGEKLSAKRPSVFFSKETEMPEVATLRCAVPAIYSGLNHAELNRLLARRVAELADQAHAELAKTGRTFMGVKAVLKQAPSREAHTEEQKRKLRPRVASKNVGVRVRALIALKQFWAEYREALRQWRAGMRDAVFPYGTYGMRQQHCARCGPT